MLHRLSLWQKRDISQNLPFVFVALIGDCECLVSEVLWGVLGWGSVRCSPLGLYGKHKFLFVLMAMVHGKEKIWIDRTTSILEAFDDLALEHNEWQAALKSANVTVGNPWENV